MDFLGQQPYNKNIRSVKEKIILLFIYRSQESGLRFQSFSRKIPLQMKNEICRGALSM